jgi:divalent anion:Na+ symporter, DASS family
VRPVRLLAAVAAGAVLWIAPAPEGLAPQAWRLFAIFAATILAILLDALPLLTAALLGLGTAVVTRVLTPADAYEGFHQSTILLIAAAFLISRSVLTSGLGRRIGLHVVARLGATTLGLGYSLFVTDALIAPAFPSNTARSGVLYPLALSLAANGDSRPDDGTASRMGAYLMLCGVTSFSISSGLWLTAMVANPVGAELARAHGVEIGFGSWLATAIVPSLVALAALPWLVFRLKPPEVKRTP